MFPDYPKLKSEISRRFTLFMRERQHFHLGAPLREIGRYTIHEGRKSEIVRADGSVEPTPMKEASSEFAIKLSEVPDLTLEQILQKLDVVGKDIAGQVAKQTFETMSEATQKIGNVVDAKGGKFDVELYFQAIEKIQIDFGDDGTPRMPTLIVGPALHDAVKAIEEKINSSPELKRRWADMMLKKKEEWRAREANRSLVG